MVSLTLTLLSTFLRPMFKANFDKSFQDPEIFAGQAPKEAEAIPTLLKPGSSETIA